MASYGVLLLHLDADKVNKILLSSIPARLAFFRDYHGDSSYKLNIRDCLRGLQIGCLTNCWFTCSALTRFPHTTNAHLDMNWIIPGEILAFKDPTINREKENRKVSKQIMRELKRCGIRVVVRLNSNDHNTNIEYYGKSYNPNDFIKEQFFHYEIPFKDVGVPSTAQANTFVALCERYGGKIAVHCHAGLGRTATMIGCYLIKHFCFDSRAACGWLKLCRRGSIMGPQHFFLDKFAIDLQKSQSECLKSFVEKSPCRPTSNSCGLSPTPSPTTAISRPPCKNNIIHIPPVNMRHRNNNNSMKKYISNVGVESVGNVRNKTTVKDLQTQKLLQKKMSQTSQRAATIKIAKPTICNSRPPSSPAAIQKKTIRESSPRPKRARKQSASKQSTARQSATRLSTTRQSATRLSTTSRQLPSRQSTSRLCYSKSVDRTSQTKIQQIKSQASNRSMKESLNRKMLESKDKKSYGDSSTALYPKDWSEWSGKIIEGLVSRSKNRLYGLINNVYAGQDYHC